MPTAPTISEGASGATCVNRLGADLTSPTAASRPRASRTGVRETSSHPVSSVSLRRRPGANSPVRMRSSSSS